MSYFSIAIPTYEMHGKGVSFLEHSFYKLNQQSFKDFEVVISDHSKSDDIKNLCHSWNDRLNIRYIKNPDNIGSSSANLNNALRNCNGKWIKILFQDDYLFDYDSLSNIYNYINVNPDIKWIATACEHSIDGYTTYRPFYPRWNNMLYLGNNTISSPSVITIKNENIKFFNNNLIWLMDVEFYKRMYDSYGEPGYINEISVVNRTWNNSITNTVSEEVKRKEFLIVKDLHDLDLSNVTLVLVSSINIKRCLEALYYSSRNIKFGSIKLITDSNFIIDGIEVVNIPKISNIDEYSKFIVYELHKYIDTEFALIIQDDGFVVNYEKWDNKFFNYDYIGAPWGLPNDNFSFRDPFGNLIRVGNGGFSLRSKKLLELPSKLNLEWKSYYGFYNEDGFFTCHNRHIFQEYGCVYADIDVAKYFSHESNIPEIQNIEPFGFHGKWSKYYNLI